MFGQKCKKLKAISTALVLRTIKYELSLQVPRAQSAVRHIHGPLLYNSPSDVTESYLWPLSEIYYCMKDSFDEEVGHSMSYGLKIHVLTKRRLSAP